MTGVGERSGCWVGLIDTYNKAECGFVGFEASLSNGLSVPTNEVGSSLEGSLLLSRRLVMSPTPTWMLFGENFATGEGNQCIS